jgi:hypothetical protein
VCLQRTCRPGAADELRRSGNGLGALNGSERQVLGARVMLVAPLFEKSAVTERHPLVVGNAESAGAAIDPLWRAFELGEVADRRFVDDAVPFSVTPLAAPFFIAKGGHQSQAAKNLCEGVAVADFGFSFDTVLVAVFARAVLRQAFVGEHEAPGITADTKNLSARAHLTVGRVIKYVALERARRVEVESRSLKA